MIRKLPDEQIAPLFDASAPCTAAGALAEFDERLAGHPRSSASAAAAHTGPGGEGSSAAKRAAAEPAEGGAPSALMGGAFTDGANPTAAEIQAAARSASAGAAEEPKAPGAAGAGSPVATGAAHGTQAAAAAIHIVDGSEFPSMAAGRMVNICCVADNSHVLLTRQEAVRCPPPARAHLPARVSVDSTT